MRRRRIGPNTVRTPDKTRLQSSSALQRTGPLLQRYSRDDVAVFSSEERRHLGIGDDADPQNDAPMAWELLYRLEPDRYERLVSAEHLHPCIVHWLPAHVDRIVEIGAGTGRLTVELVKRCRVLTAIEPAAPLRELLRQKLDRMHGAVAEPRASWPRLQLIGGFFDALPLPDRVAELVIACSALTPEASHGGERGLAEMERLCATGGMVVIVWPNGVSWLRSQGYRHITFSGRMTMTFASLGEAIELASIFYPQAVDEIRRREKREVPYELLGVNPPRDLAYKRIV